MITQASFAETCHGSTLTVQSQNQTHDQHQDLGSASSSPPPASLTGNNSSFHMDAHSSSASAEQKAVMNVDSTPSGGLTAEVDECLGTKYVQRSSQPASQTAGTSLVSIRAERKEIASQRRRRSDQSDARYYSDVLRQPQIEILFIIL